MNARLCAVTIATSTLVVATAAGCGGGSSGLSHSALDSKANAICLNEITTGKKIPVPSNIEDASGAAAYFDKVYPLVAAATTKLEALKPNKDDAADWKSFISLRQQGQTLLATIRHKADTKDASGLKDLAKSPASQAKIAAAAKKVGATTCAQ